MKKFGSLTSAEQVTRLHSEIGPYMLRRKKEDVDADIPNKEEILVEVDLTSIQVGYYRAILEKDRKVLTSGSQVYFRGLMSLLNFEFFL